MKLKTKKTMSDIAFDILNYSFFIIFTIICIYPFYYLIINSISANDLSAAGMINFFPKGIHFQNYVDVLHLDGIFQAAFISVARTVIGSVLTVGASAFMGYMFTQEKLPYRKALYRIVIVTMYFNAGLIPIFMTMKNLHLTNTFWVYVIPTMVQPFNIILVKTYIESTPKALQEAAEIDGANFFTVFWRIVLPISKPILATIMIFAAVGQWNSFQDTLLYITDSDLYTLQYLLQQFINQASSLASLVTSMGSSAGANIAAVAQQQTPTSIRITVAVIVVLPILFVYPIFQKHFVKGIMIGSVKE